ncbi:hypothetical protein D3C84_628040 [compost metagenome]
MALPRSKVGMGKGQLLRCPIAPFAMGHLLFGPMQEPRTMRLEKRLQLIDAKRFDQTGFLLADDIEIHQCQIDVCQIEFSAHQPTVDFRLGPVQLPVVGRLFAQVATVGLHLFQAVLHRVIAVRPALDGQRLKASFKGDFALIAVTAT